MPHYTSLIDHHPNSQPGTGILITNLGTPQAPTTGALRRYLAEFLGDRRVIELPRLPWLALLHGVILNTRPRRSAHAYQKIWREDGSPLLTIAQKQAAALQAVLPEHFNHPVKVALGMRYGSPSIEDGLEELRRANARRILILPLYPQYSATTVATTFDAAAEVLKRWRWIPDLRFVSHYHDDPGYIEALAGRIQAYWNEQGQPDKLLFSFHGLPESYALSGDPYFCECHRTAHLVAEKLQIPPDRWMVVFQSRFGRSEWLKPYLDVTLAGLPEQGVKSVQVIAPGFSVDCLETLEEIAMAGKEIFLKAGGEAFGYIPALNDGPDHVALIADLIVKHSQGWHDIATDQLYCWRADVDGYCSECAPTGAPVQSAQASVHSEVR